MKKILGTVIVFLFSALIFSVPVKGEEKITEELIKKMEFDEVQDMLNEMLGEGSFSFSAYGLFFCSVCQSVRKFVLAFQVYEGVVPCLFSCRGSFIRRDDSCRFL